MSDDQAVLYVEDEAMLRTLAAATLEDAGFEVVLAENGNAALEILDENAEPFCAVITDVNLGPGPDGWEIAERARELNSTLPVIYVTGAAGADWKTKRVANSVMLSKPFTPSQIVRALSDLLRELNRP